MSASAQLSNAEPVYLMKYYEDNPEIPSRVEVLLMFLCTLVDTCMCLNACVAVTRALCLSVDGNYIYIYIFWALTAAKKQKVRHLCIQEIFAVGQSSTHLSDSNETQ